MKITALSIFLLLLLYGCTKDSSVEVFSKPPGCDSMAFSYKNDIEPILNSNCNLPLCHGTGGEGSYDYTTYAVVADRIRTGRFTDRLKLPLDDSQHMPVGIKMNPCELYRLITWIEQGYPDN